ncbi:MAG: MEDS domain-containing protein [Nitrospirota bacterium]
MPRTNDTESPLFEALKLLQVHDHISLIYNNPEERFAAVVPFLRIGLERGERCLCIATESDYEIVMAALADSGIDIADVLARGALVITTQKEFHHTDGPVDAGRLVGLYYQAVTDAKDAGFNTLRVCADVCCIPEACSEADLVGFEAGINDLIKSSDITVLCLYDLNRYSPQIIREIIRTHPKLIFGGMVCNNYTTYLPPDKYFQLNRVDVEVESLLHGMLATEITLNNLQVQKSLLKAVFENTPDMVYVKDLNGRYLMINPAGADFFGKSIDEVLGRTAGELLPPEDAAPLAEADRRAMASDKPVSTELTFKAAGIARTFLAIKGVYRDAKGDVIGIFGISRDITEQKRTESEIIANHEELRFMASEISRKEERERRSIASALHDQIGQTLALAMIKLQSIAWGEDFKGEVNQVCELLDNAIQHTRSLTIELSPPVLYELGLEAAAESLCEEFQRLYGLEINFRGDVTTESLTDEIRVLLYQGLRELLVNVVKHAGASSASVTIEKDWAFIRITVEDNGIGFDGSEKNIRADKKHGFGLFSLRERLKYLGGSFDVTSAPGRGTQITLVAPLHPAQ